MGGNSCLTLLGPSFKLLPLLMMGEMSSYGREVPLSSESEVSTDKNNLSLTVLLEDRSKMCFG